MSKTKEWLIRKGGYYYKPNRAGYTVSPLEAGRYTEEEARAEASVEPWHMKAVHISEVMEMIDKDGTETRHYGPPVSREEFEELGKRVSELAFEIGAMVGRPAYVYTVPARQQGKSWLYERYMQAKRDDQPQPDSDGWIPWHGGECPVPYDTKVEVWFRDNEPAMGPRTDWAKHLVWRHSGEKYDIIAYRPAKQEAEWPQVGDDFWYICSDGQVDWGLWDNAPKTDRGTADFLGVFQSREQAEEAAGKIRRVMDHLRAGESVYLIKGGAGERIDL